MSENKYPCPAEKDCSAYKAGECVSGWVKKFGRYCSNHPINYPEYKPAEVKSEVS